MVLVKAISFSRKRLQSHTLAITNQNSSNWLNLVDPFNACTMHVSMCEVYSWTINWYYSITYSTSTAISHHDLWRRAFIFKQFCVWNAVICDFYDCSQLFDGTVNACRMQPRLVRSRFRMWLRLLSNLPPGMSLLLAPNIAFSSAIVGFILRLFRLNYKCAIIWW